LVKNFAEAGNQTQSALADNRSAAGCPFDRQIGTQGHAFGRSGGSGPRQFNLFAIKIDKG
jgi:hypothetical protein